MDIDLRTCKVGQKLRTRSGMIVTYMGENDIRLRDMYPHKIKYPTGWYGSRCDDGFVFVNDRRPEDEDIVEIL